MWWNLYGWWTYFSSLLYLLSRMFNGFKWIKSHILSTVQENIVKIQTKWILLTFSPTNGLKIIFRILSSKMLSELLSVLSNRPKSNAALSSFTVTKVKVVPFVSLPPILWSGNCNLTSRYQWNLFKTLEFLNSRK